MLQVAETQNPKYNIPQGLPALLVPDSFLPVQFLYVVKVSYLQKDITTMPWKPGDRRCDGDELTHDDDDEDADADGEEDEEEDYLFIYGRLIAQSTNRTGSPQGFSLNPFLQKWNTIQSMHIVQT